jgi:hypothetical protein
MVISDLTTYHCGRKPRNRNNAMSCCHLVHNATALYLEALSSNFGRTITFPVSDFSSHSFLQIHSRVIPEIRQRQFPYTRARFQYSSFAVTI